MAKKSDLAPDNPNTRRSRLFLLADKNKVPLKSILTTVFVVVVVLSPRRRTVASLAGIT